MPYGDRRLYGVCVAEKGTFRFNVAHDAAPPATPRCPAWRDNALLKLAPVIARLGDGPPAAIDLTRGHARAARGARRGPDDPAAALERDRARSTPRLAPLVEPTLRVTFAPTIVSRGREDQRDPGARASCASTAASRPGWASDVGAARASREVLGDGRPRARVHRGRSSATARRSTSPLMDAIARLGRRAGPRRRGRARPSCPRSPTAAGSAPRSRTASPTASSRSATRRSTRPGR